jgi:glycosyltransferase involved in cell wall biosynthesis
MTLNRVLTGTLSSQQSTTVGVLGGQDPNGSGGLESVVRNIAVNSPDSYEYVHYCSGPETRTTRSDVGEVNMYTGGVGRIRSKHVYSLRAARDLARRDVDLVHGHGDNCLGLHFFPPERPYVVTFHGTAAGMYENVFSDSNPLRRALSRVRMFPERVAARQCDVAVACSPMVRDELVQQYGTDPEKVVVIRNGVDTSRFVPAPRADAAERLDIPLDQRYILWIGTDPRRKRLRTALRVVDAIDEDLQLLVIGREGTDTSSVRYLGYVPEERIVDAYSAAEVLLFPSLYEGDPLVIWEALSCGLPVVTSPFMPEYETGVRYAPAHEVDAYVDCLVSVLSDPPDRAALRESVLDSDWERVTETYLDLFDRVMR